MMIGKKLKMKDYKSISKLEEQIQPHTEWEKLSEKIHKGERIIVIGEMDSGKTSFCHFICNKFRNVAIFDLDPGQQNLFLPSCISAKLERKFLKFFIGKFSPRGAENMILMGLKIFMEEIFYRSKPSVALIDTSGYVSDDRALLLKFSKCLIFKPTKIVFMIKNESKQIQKIKKIISKYFQTIDLPSHDKTKTILKEKREQIRNLKIKSYFENCEETIIKNQEANIINLDYSSNNDNIQGQEIIGFFKHKLTSFLGLIKQEDEDSIKVIFPKNHKNWDFIIRSGLKIKL